MATAMLMQCGLPSAFWPEAMEWAAHCHNSMYSNTKASQTITEELMGFEPNQKRYWEFGCDCIYWDPPKSNREKFTGTGRRAFYLGWSLEQNGYKVYDNERGLVVTHSAKFTDGKYRQVDMFIGRAGKKQPTPAEWTTGDERYAAQCSKQVSLQEVGHENQERVQVSTGGEKQMAEEQMTNEDDSNQQGTVPVDLMNPPQGKEREHAIQLRERDQRTRQNEVNESHARNPAGGMQTDLSRSDRVKRSDPEHKKQLTPIPEKGNLSNKNPDPQSSESDEDEYEVGRVLDQRVGPTGEIEYKIRWKGYTAK